MFIYQKICIERENIVSIGAVCIRWYERTSQMYINDSSAPRTFETHQIGRQKEGTKVPKKNGKKRKIGISASLWIVSRGLVPVLPYICVCKRIGRINSELVMCVIRN